VATANYVTIDSKALACIGAIEKVVQSTTTTLYAAFVATGAPNLAATTDIQIAFGFEYIN
jgi:DNA-binding phage protein